MGCRKLLQEEFFPALKVVHSNFSGKENTGASLEYFAFGETFVEEHSNTDRTPYLFNGKEQDEETGLYYYGARYYDGKSSVWLSVDPSAEHPNQVDKSPYAYAWNNPIVYNDPDGECPRCPRNQYQSRATQNYQNNVRRQEIITSYRYSQRLENMNGARERVTVGTHDKPQTREGQLTWGIIKLGDQYRKFNEKLNVSVERREIVNVNGYGGERSEGSKFHFSGPDAIKLEMMENAFQSKANEAFDKRFSAFASQKLGTDFNSLSPEEQAKFKSENGQMAALLKSIIGVEMGPSPKQQLIQQAEELFKQGVFMRKEEVKELPVIREASKF